MGGSRYGKLGVCRPKAVATSIVRGPAGSLFSATSRPGTPRRSYANSSSCINPTRRVRILARRNTHHGPTRRADDPSLPQPDASLGVGEHLGSRSGVSPERSALKRLTSPLSPNTRQARSAKARRRSAGSSARPRTGYRRSWPQAGRWLGFFYSIKKEGTPASFRLNTTKVACNLSFRVKRLAI